MFIIICKPAMTINMRLSINLFLLRIAENSTKLDRVDSGRSNVLKFLSKANEFFPEDLATSFSLNAIRSAASANSLLMHVENSSCIYH